MDHHLADAADGMLSVDHLIYLLIGIIPGGLVIGEHMDMVLRGQTYYTFRIFDGSGQRLFHHDRDAFWRAKLYHAQVLGDGVVSQHRIGMDMFQQCLQAGIEQGVRQMIAVLVALDQLLVRLCNACDDHLTPLELIHDIVHMVMGQAGYTYP